MMAAGRGETREKCLLITRVGNKHGGRGVGLCWGGGGGGGEGAGARLGGGGGGGCNAQRRSDPPCEGEEAYTRHSRHAKHTQHTCPSDQVLKRGRRARRFPPPSHPSPLPPLFLLQTVFQSGSVRIRCRFGVEDFKGRISSRQIGVLDSYVDQLRKVCLQLQHRRSRVQTKGSSSLQERRPHGNTD